MTTSLLSTCPLSGANTGEPDCAKRLLLHDCLDQWEREAQFGECDTGHYRCRFVAWGRGPTLVLIPGIASDPLSFVLLMARLQAHFRCISYELPTGLGDGARLMRYTHGDLVQDLFALLDHLKIRECFLFGFSFGSTIALSALHQQAGRFTRTILQSGFAHHPLAAAEVFCASWGRFVPGRLASLPFFERVLSKNQREPFLAREPEVWDHFVERQGRTPIRAFCSRALLMHQTDLRPLLPSIPVPLLLACGERDTIVGRSCTQDLMRGLPFAAHAEIEACGHQAHLSHPEVLAEITRQFLLPATCGS
jgi:pimeloyl-ACP methyl ester carboxylesterase